MESTLTFFQPLPYILRWVKYLELRKISQNHLKYPEVDLYEISRNTLEYLETD